MWPKSHQLNRLKPVQIRKTLLKIQEKDSLCAGGPVMMADCHLMFESQTWGLPQPFLGKLCYLLEREIRKKSIVHSQQM